MKSSKIILLIAALGLWSCTKMNFTPSSEAVEGTGIIPNSQTPTPTPTPGIGGGGATPTPTATPGGNPTPSPTPTATPSPTPNGGGNPTPTPPVGPNPTPTPGNPSPTPSPTPTCTPSVANIYRQTKILFIVDMSGSNVDKSRDEGTQECFPKDKDYAQCTPATDPQKTLRAGSLQSFFDTYSYKTNFDWGLATFSGTTSQSLINSPVGDSPVFSTQAGDFQSALKVFESEQDSGATPYSAAIALATSMIQNDPDLNSEAAPDYDVIFLTDGYPTDYGAYTTGTLDVAALDADIEKMLGIASGRVNLSTVYYGTVDDPHAIALLQSLAKLGGGQFKNAKDKSTIKIDDLIPNQVQQCNN